MTRRLHGGCVRRALGTAVVLAPVAWAAYLLATDLHARPEGRVALPPPAAAPLAIGTSLGVSLAVDDVRYRALSVRLAAAAPATIGLRLCCGGVCDERSSAVADGSVVALAVPAPCALGGELALTVTALTGGPTSARGDAGTPALEAVQGYTWRLPARRARQVFAAYTGVDAFGAALGACAVALAAGLALTFALGAGPRGAGALRAASAPGWPSPDGARSATSGDREARTHDRNTGGSR